MNGKAQRTTWKNFPIVNPKRIEINLQFTEEQFKKLILGFTPKAKEAMLLSMKRKWKSMKN